MYVNGEAGELIRLTFLLFYSVLCAGVQRGPASEPHGPSGAVQPQGAASGAKGHRRRRRGQHRIHHLRSVPAVNTPSMRNLLLIAQSHAKCVCSVSTFSVLFPRHTNVNARDNTINLIHTFRDYLHYHIKCSKVSSVQRGNKIVCMPLFTDKCSFIVVMFNLLSNHRLQSILLILPCNNKFHRWNVGTGRQWKYTAMWSYRFLR